jgi:hypothetical protein
MSPFFLTKRNLLPCLRSKGTQEFFTGQSLRLLQSGPHRFDGTNDREDSLFRRHLKPLWMEEEIRMMQKVLLGILIVVLFPFYSMAFISVHELGHVAVLRLYGDEEAWFYLVKVDENGRCLGCTTSGQLEMPWTGQLLQSAGGLIATQTVALTALLLLSFRPRRRWMVRTLSIVALTFAFFDILAQVPQGLYYNLDQMMYKTSVDLVDFMLLLQMKIDAGQSLLKGVLLASSVLYLFGFTWLYRRSRRLMSSEEPALVTSQEALPPSPGIS